MPRSPCTSSHSPASATPNPNPALPLRMQLHPRSPTCISDRLRWVTVVGLCIVAIQFNRVFDEGPTGWRSPCLSVFDFPLFYFCTLYCISLPRSYTSCAMLRRRGLGVGRGAQISGRGRECGGYGGGCWLWKGRVQAKHRTRTERCGNRTPCGLGHSGSGVGLFGPQSVHKGEGHAPAHRVGSRGPNPLVVAAARVQAGGKGAHFRLPLGCTLVFSRAP